MPPERERKSPRPGDRERERETGIGHPAERERVRPPPLEKERERDGKPHTQKERREKDPPERAREKTKREKVLHFHRMIATTLPRENYHPPPRERERERYTTAEKKVIGREREREGGRERRITDENTPDFSPPLFCSLAGWMATWGSALILWKCGIFKRPNGRCRRPIELTIGRFFKRLVR